MTPLLKQKFADMLIQEKQLLERELKSVGRIDPSNPSDWEASANGPYTETAEIEGRASEISDFEDNNAVEVELENHYNKITAALVRIEDGSFGICKVCSQEIEEDRLSANPAAETCKKDIDS